jgi:hypothetical protein
MNRKKIIEEVADDISCGITHYVSTADIIDWMMDEGKISPATVAGLLSIDQDVRLECSYNLRQLVEAEAVNFFTNNDRGIEYIDQCIADRQAEEDEAARDRMTAE